MAMKAKLSVGIDSTMRTCSASFSTHMIRQYRSSRDSTKKLESTVLWLMNRLFQVFILFILFVIVGPYVTA